jgi:hypothetical protein
MQPVYFGDIAESILKILKPDSIGGKIYGLAGPKVYTFKEIFEFILKETNRSRVLDPVPFWMAAALAVLLSFCLLHQSHQIKLSFFSMIMLCHLITYRLRTSSLNQHLLKPLFLNILNVFVLLYSVDKYESLSFLWGQL